MKMLRTIIDCKSLENSQENVMTEFISVKLQAYSLNTTTSGVPRTV